MAEYNEVYTLNSSDTQTVTADQQTVVPNIALSSVNKVLLTINGVVYTGTEENPTPINGARVIAYGPNGNPIADDITATRGTQVGAYSLVFEGERNVNYRVTASLDGYVASTDEVTFTNTDVISLLFLLLQTQNTLAIYGRVVDTATGVGIENVNIRIVGNGDTVTLETGPDGSFIAYDDFVPSVNYNVTASKLGYDNQTKTITIATGTNGRNVTFALVSDATNLTNITGRVIIEGSNPPVGIPNAFVGLFSGNVLVDSQFTDELGSYAFVNIDASQRYVVKATKIERVNTTTNS